MLIGNMKINEETGEKEIVSAPYLEDTKLELHKISTLC